MLFSIVLGFGNTWFLLCLEIPDADGLSGCVCLEIPDADGLSGCACLEIPDADGLNGCVCLDTLHSDCFCCMWYLLSGNAAFSLDECPSSLEGGSIFVVPAF